MCVCVCVGVLPLCREADGVFAKMKKKLETLTQTIRIYSQDIGWKFGIKMCFAHNEKWEKRNHGRNRVAKTGKNQNAWRKRKLQVLGNIERGYRQTSRDERKKKDELENFSKP